MSDHRAPTTAEAAMVSLVGSLADNKAALGPPLRRVGGQRADPRVRGRRRGDGPGRARPRALDLPRAQGARRRARRGGSTAAAACALLDDELPDWTAFIAANLLVDGVLTTFVAACADSSLEPMAQRARKILQEEGSHRVHAEAWARRLCRSGAASATLLVARLRETWEQAGALGRARRRPGLRRGASTRAWCPRRRRSSASRCARGSSALLAAEGVAIALDEPGDWSGWDPDAALDAVSAADLPVLRRRRRRARRPVGRADHHRAVALPRVRLVLRGGPRGLRRPARRSGRAALGLERAEVVLCRLVPCAWRSAKRSWARSRGQPAGSMSSGRSGSRNGNLRHSCTSSVWARKTASGVRGRRRPKRRDEVAVGGGDRVEVPRLGDDLAADRRARRSRRGTRASSATEPSPDSRAARCSRSTCGLIHSPPPSEPKPAHASRVRTWWRTSRRSSGTRRTTSSQRPSHVPRRRRSE